MGIKQKEEHSSGGLHNALAAGTIIKGNIIAEYAEILGKITGNVQVTNKLVLKATAIIKGDISSRQLEIEPNAQLNGTCRMENPIKA